MVIAVLGLRAHAGDLQIAAVTPDGSPAANVVVWMPSDGEKAPERFEWPNEMSQENKQFTPHVLIVPVGSEVAFPNRDRIRHHVYSFSKGNRFELKLYGRDESRGVTLKNTGLVAVGCNIHDQMSGYLRVVDTPFAAKTDASGIAVLKDLPAEPGKIRVWFPGAPEEGETLHWDGEAAALTLIVKTADAGQTEHGHAHGHH